MFKKLTWFTFLLVALSMATGLVYGQSVNINFQPASSEEPNDYLPDTGLLFGDRGNGFSYGWDRDTTADARDRNSANALDQRYDTVMHFSKQGDATWEIALIDGEYDLFIVCGDPGYTDQTNTLDIEGTLVVDLDGQSAENYFDEFAAFVGAFVARYPDTVSSVIIWNEPNLSLEWGGRDVDPEAYTELLRRSYVAARAANPDIRVLGGALAPTTETEGSAAGMNEFSFLARMYEAGAAPYFDALAAHTYGFTQPPEAEPDSAAINFRRIELLREIMRRYGDAEKPVIITESGWNDDPRWVNAVRPGQRIAYTLRAFEMVEAWPWAEQLCIWNFRQPFDRYNRRDAYYALVSSDFTIKPIYEAIQAYARGWENPYAP